MKLSHIFKVILLLLLPFFVLAQYPNNPVKSRLGYQTTGDGLVFRGAGAPAYSPGTLFNAWTYLDTTNMILYGYKNFSWVRLPSANNGLTMSGAYAQLGGSLNQNTTVESSTYNLKLGKTSGTNYAYMNTYGSGEYAGMYSVFGAIETDFGIGGGAYNLTSNDADDTNQFSFEPTGFDFSYIGGSGVSRFRMDSTKFNMVGLDSYASHAAANAVELTNNLYMLNDSRHIYINSGTGSADILGSGTADRSARWSATNTLAAGNITDNGTKLQALLPFQLHQWTTAGRPTGVDGYMGYNSSFNWLDIYSISGWFSPARAATSGGAFTAGYIPFGGTGGLTESSTFTHLSNKLTLGVPSGSNPVVDIVVGVGDGTVNESAGMRLRHRSNNGNTHYMQLGVSNVAKGGSNQGFAYIQGGYWGGAYTNPLFINPKGGFVGFGAVFSAEWEVSVKNAIGINAPLFPPALGQGGRLVFASNKGLNAPAQIVAWYDQANWYQGTGLVFKTESGADVSGAANQGIERMRISSDGLVGIGKTPVTYLLDVGGTTAIGFPRGTTGTRPTWVTATTPMRFNTDTTAFEYATAAGTWSLLATRAYARSLVSGLPTTWLKTELEASRDVNINGGSSTDFRIQNTRIQFDGRVKFGADSTFVHDPVQDTTFAYGYSKFGKQPSDDSFYDFTFRTHDGGSTALLIESGRDPSVNGTAEFTLRPSGRNNAVVSYGNTTSGKGLAFYNVNAGKYVMYMGSSGYVTGNSRTIIIGDTDDPINWGGNGSLVIFDTITSGKALFFARKAVASSVPLAMFSSASNDRFTFNDNGITRFHVYGTNATTATTLSKTESGYLASFATDGTVLSKADNTERYNNITSTTSPVTLSSTIADNLINQGSTQATFTLNMPASPINGQVVMITYNNAITTLTIHGNGNTIVGSAVTTAVAGSQRKFKFYTGIGWIKQY